jgi:hypothetical protein
MLIEQETDPDDPIEQRSIRCEIEVHHQGMVTVLRSPGCTVEDVLEMCRTVGSGGVRVHDVTPGAIATLFPVRDERTKTQSSGSW